MKTRYRRLAPALLLFAWVAVGSTAGLDPEVYLDDVRYLASKDLRGRGDGSPELEKAAAFISGKFHDFGLRPLEGKSYYQAFEVTGSAQLGKANEFHITESGHRSSLRIGDDYVPFNFSSAARLEGPVVFAGYGITAPEYHYDDYAGIDVKGKVVVILRHEPQEFDEHSVFSGRSFTQHAQFASKASNAKMHGAAGVILVADRTHHITEADTLEKFGSTAGPGDAGIPFAQVKAEKVQSWFSAAGKRLDTTTEDIDRTLQPESFAFPESIRVDANLDLERVVKTVHNVVGYLPGDTGEYVIIGAHYDHIGLGEQYSMSPATAGTVHPGADDNASGTAGVIELARWFSTQPKQKRGVLFLAFAGEELGLLGSSYFVSHPAFPLENAVAMINLDMIGRVRDSKVYIGGLATGTGLKTEVDRAALKYALNADYSDTSGYGASDHSSFTTRQVPVLFFFSGLHSDYHRPSDTWDKINAPDAARVLRMVAEIAGDLRRNPDRPQFVHVNTPPQAGDAAGAAGSYSGYGPYFGSVPDFGESKAGMRFADVNEGSPAAAAGLKGGDVLVEFDGKPVQNLYDFTYALRARQPGDEVAVKVLRDGKPVVAKVTLTNRK